MEGFGLQGRGGGEGGEKAVFYTPSRIGRGKKRVAQRKLDISRALWLRTASPPLLPRPEQPTRLFSRATLGIDEPT